MAPDGVARGRTRWIALSGFGVAAALVLVALASALQPEPARPTPTMDPQLVSLLPITEPVTRVLVVVTFWNPADRGLLDLLAPNYKFRALPMAGALLTPAQILTLSTLPQVRSIWHGDRTFPILLRESRDLVHASEATALFGVTGAGVTVAVIDTGVDSLHPDFAGPGGSRVRNLEVVLGPSGTCTFLPVPHSDDIGHGTHVAGTIAGNGALGGGAYTGMAPAARIVSYDTNAGLFIILFEALCAYDDVITTRATTGIRVISNSWGGGDGTFDRDDPIEIAIRTAYESGVASVFAAGNSGPGANTMSSQSVSPYAIGVAAVTKKSQVVGFSSRGRPLDWPSDPWPATHDRDAALAGDLPLFRPAISAPGVSITAPVPCTPLCTSSTGYGVLSGTSMATPHVSGVLALMLEIHPGLTPRQMVGVLEVTAHHMPEWLAWEAGAGLVHALNAVGKSNALRADPTTPIPDPFLDESIDARTTSRSSQGPVIILGSATSASPGSCPTPAVCRDFIVVVPSFATRLLVRIEWTNGLQNFYGFAFAPGQSVTDFPTQEDTGLLDVPLDERGLDIRMPTPGEWRIRVLPRTNVVDSVQLMIVTSTL